MFDCNLKKLPGIPRPPGGPAKPVAPWLPASPFWPSTPEMINHTNCSRFQDFSMFSHSTRSFSQNQILANNSKISESI